MFYSDLISLTLAFLAFLQPALTLGINCRGSGVCPLAGFENDGDVSVLQGLRDAMYSVPNSTVSGSTIYADGDHVICVSSSIKISISVGVSAKGVSGKIGLNGKLGIGGVCAFAQDTNGAGITLDRARQLMDGLLDHGCSVCGSNPTQPGNNVKNGELTVNYVKNPSCTGNCLGAGAGLNPSAGQGETSSADGAGQPATSLKSSSSSTPTASASSTSKYTGTAATVTTSNVPSYGGSKSQQSYTAIPYIAWTTVAIQPQYRPRGLRV